MGGSVLACAAMLPAPGGRQRPGLRRDAARTRWPQRSGLGRGPRSPERVTGCWSIFLIVTSRPAPRDLRASDADRDRVISMLSAAAGDGRLTSAEHSERVERAYTARTLGDLAPLTADLAEPSAQPFRLDTRTPVLAVFAKESRDGRWVVPATLPVVAVFGEVMLDVREALLQSQRITVYATVVGGTLELIVPDGVTVEMYGTSVLTRKVNKTPRQPAEGMPVIEVRAASLGGTIRVISPRKSRRLGGFRRNGLSR
jgi:hypothetical protein